MITNEQAVYFKEYLLLKNAGNNLQRISTSLFESKISINPHQINAALKFFENPRSKGMIFADEVGLGKTIEAGLVISQYWYEKKRKILIIAPASLMKQWNEELYLKFHLDSKILTSSDYKKTHLDYSDKILITSYNSVYLNESFFQQTFDLIVIDEAHKLRNVYRESGVMANSIKKIFDGQKKLLLTATPFQNNLMELYGLMSIIDESLFPDSTVFKKKYVGNKNVGDIAQTLKNFVVRTLRKDVTKYINYTKRNVSLIKYTPNENEIKFDEMISHIMFSDDFRNTYNTGQSHLIIILLLKLLSSSRYAVTSTLEKMKVNLQSDKTEFFDKDFEINCDVGDIRSNGYLLNNINKVIDFSKNMGEDSKINKLLETLHDLNSIFDSQDDRNRKVLIFTESKQTQKHLFEAIRSHTRYKVLQFNGQNTGEEINELYLRWKEKQTTTISGNKDINVRRAIVDAFESEYDILIATDAAAEGLNMQFCSVLINYDLPWNPQKVEQRIGRCHRYGQKNDVIVFNFLNSHSFIDNHIYALLNGKLGIFEETFGTSDAILNSGEFGEDIERAVREIFKKCRTPQEIEAEFDRVQKEYEEEIIKTRKRSEQELEEHFDEEVQRNFELQYIKANNIVNEMEYLLFKTLVHVLKLRTYNLENFSFNHGHTTYTTSNKYAEQFEFCSLNSGIVQAAFDQIPSNNKESVVQLRYSDSNLKIGYVNSNSLVKGKIKVSKLSYESFDTTEALILTGVADNGVSIPSDVCHKLLKLDSVILDVEPTIDIDLNNVHSQSISNKIQEIEDYNQSIFAQESDYINNWADSMIEKVQLSVQEMREERKNLQIEFDFSNDISAKALIQEKIKTISKKITKSWVELAELEDEIEERRERLIKNLKQEDKRLIHVRDLFVMEFVVK